MAISRLLRSAFVLFTLLPGVTTAGDGPLRIGVSGPAGEDASQPAWSMREGIRIAAAAINEAGGVLGRPVQLVEYGATHHGGRGAYAAAAQPVPGDLAAGIGAVSTGGTGADAASAALLHYQQARIPFIAALATGASRAYPSRTQEWADDFIFHVSASDTVQAEMMGAEAVDRRGFTRIAILYDEMGREQTGQELLERALARRDIRPVLVERFPQRRSGVIPQLKRIRAADAQAILIHGPAPRLNRLADGMARLEWFVPLIGNRAQATPDSIEDAHWDTEGARVPQTFIPDRITPQRRAFMDAWRQRTGSTRIPAPSAAAQGYDSMLLLAAAIRQAGSARGDDIRAALENLHAPVTGLIMTYHRPFSRTHHEALTAPGELPMGELRNGRIVFAWQEERWRAASR